MGGGLHIFLLVTMLALVGAAHLSNETDRQALLAFKNQINNDPHKALDSWNNSHHFCHWQGVLCGHRLRRVVEVNLSCFDLDGYISPYIGNLSFLRFITLPNNSFQGEIPEEIGRLPHLRGLNLEYNSLEGGIPATLSNCSHLQYIFLSRNKLVGHVPPELGLLFELKGLLLGGNGFDGVFPPFLTNLSSLTGLALAYNSFRGPIPEEVGKLSGLLRLHLGGNRFYGELPPTVYNLSNIEMFAINENQVSGRLSPDMAYFFPKLEILNLFANYFTGKIPISLCNSSHLQVLGFNDNNFMGSLPVGMEKLHDLAVFNFAGNQLGEGKGDDLFFLNSLINCSKLQVLSVASNNLSGSLPASIANLTRNIRLLYLHYNHIHGRIPSGFESISSLEKLDLSVNFLTGVIPDELGKLPNLGGLYLNYNRLSGQIPLSLGNLSHLVELHLIQNHLQGAIPSSIGNCTSLQFLFLYNNFLSGSIPRQLFDIRSLVFLDLSNNSFGGNLPLEVGQLQNLNCFNVSLNRISGEIPASLAKCKSLVFLNLSSNSFVGTIPMSLEALVATEEVDLSSNNLTGKIPTYFTNFTAIQFLDLSFNNLSGEVPVEGPFGNVSKISVWGNNGLCGGILELHLPPCPRRNGGRREHKAMPIFLKMILSVALATSTCIALCCVLACCWRKRPRNEPTSSTSMEKQYVQLSYAELHEATNGFSVANLIGSGSFGSVYRGVSDSFEMDIAIKVIKNVEHASIQRFIAECEALKQVRHRNIVKILTSCSSVDFQGNQFQALVFKFMQNGSLDSWLHANSGRDLYLSFSERLDVAIDIAHALNYLHNHCETPIIHCDLKPHNILLDENMIAHVSDFNLAKVLLNVGDDSSCTSMLKGSIGYIPPEYGVQSKVTRQGDVYSYGVLLLEMFTGRRPTDEMFKDGISISKLAETHLNGRLKEIVDRRLILYENMECTNFRNCVSSVIEIGIACAAELPQDRASISRVCVGLQATREAYQT